MCLLRKEVINLTVDHPVHFKKNFNGIDIAVFEVWNSKLVWNVSSVFPQLWIQFNTKILFSILNMILAIVAVTFLKHFFRPVVNIICPKIMRKTYEIWIIAKININPLPCYRYSVFFQQFLLKGLKCKVANLVITPCIMKYLYFEFVFI